MKHWLKRRLVRLLRWLTKDEPVLERLYHVRQPDKEVMRQNDHLSRLLQESRRETTKAIDEGVVKARKARDEALEACQWRAYDLGYKDLAEEIARQRRMQQ